MEEILKDSNEIVPEKRKEKKKSGGRGWLVFKIIMFVIFLLYAISLIYPVFYGFLTSLKSQSEFMEDPNRLPQEWLFSYCEVTTRLPSLMDTAFGHHQQDSSGLSGSLLSHLIACGEVVQISRLPL